ncbi:hypothetical protein [Antarcticirhabdus aurantiaca]|uniref:Uncharacterized protein n=1 Tax=Antarcticirhabdus aurantiaca TaxID=2606717 RepID=A0ACD4NUW4_9HYPH|nr:hypothetical protein [Antarcticirhabdus aurantiaca]WAJ30513.1 hypothetical protein OXU80_10040 [Jeongeuplla avenae]
MPNALAEVSDRIPAPIGGRDGEPREAGPAVGTGPARRLIEDGLSRLDKRAAEGGVEARAARTLIETVPKAADREAAAVRLGLVPGAEEDASALYALAFEADATGATGEAVLILGLLAGSAWGEVEGCLGLSVIACRLRLFAEAQVLAERCLQAEARHPRALSVAGICALERGDMAGAQSYLAAAARLARANPELRQDLQAAQRALLLMHLSS